MRYLAFTFVCLASSIAVADSKEACVDAHSRGQDAKEQGRIAFARKLFLSCAQPGCPTAVQADCARFADDLANLQPTVNFVARDANGNDLPNTTVYVDGLIVATVIDGRPVDVDPGSHTVKFSSGGKDETVTVVIAAGEKGRTVIARFGAPAAVAAHTTVVASKAGARTKHPSGAKVLMIGGGVLALGGTAVAIWAKSQIPSQCNLGTHECAASPGDPVFDEAASATRNLDVGLVAASVGAAAVLGGAVWYVAGGQKVRESPMQAWVNHDGGGVAVMGRF